MDYKNIKVVPVGYESMKRIKYLFKFNIGPSILVSGINERDAIDTIIHLGKPNYSSYSIVNY